MADFSWKPEYADIFKNAEPEVAWSPEVADPKSTGPAGFSAVEIELAKKMAIRVDGPKMGPHTWQDHLIMAREMLKKNPDFAKQFMAVASSPHDVMSDVELDAVLEENPWFIEDYESKHCSPCTEDEFGEPVFAGKHKDNIPGGKADKKSPKDFNRKQLEKGRKHEMEHTKDKALALEIAMDHLTEDPKYYDHLDAMEKKFK